MKLLHKLSLLVLLPISFEFIFVGLLYYFQNQADRDRQTYLTAQEVMHTLNNISGEYYNLGSTAALCATTHESTFSDRYQVLKRNLLNEVSQLETLLKDNKSLSTSVAKIRTLAVRNIKEMDQFLDGDGAGMDLSLLKKHQAMASDVGAMESKKIADAQAAIIKKGPLREAQWHRNVQWLIFVAAGSSLLLTIVLLRLITADLVGRVSTIVSNSERIPAKKSLSEPVKGNDEIAILDSFIHEMATKLDQADSERREFISMVTHDVRAPLTNLRFLLAMLIEGSYDHDLVRMKRRIASMEPELERINRMMEDLLFLDKSDDALILEKIELIASELIDTACDSLSETAADKKIELKRLPADVQLLGDKDRLLQVLVNIISNAIVFSPENSTIEVGVNRLDRGVEFTISDQGPGVPEDEAERIFDRFKQGQNTSSKIGFGLGLAISKRLVELHDGEIGVRQRQGENGSEFWFFIPRA